jgi:hypothetical protein
MNDQLKQYFEYLQKAGADVPPSFDSFKSTLSDEKEAQTYFNYLKTNKFDTPDTFDSFYSTFGFKKKDSPVSQTGAPNVGQPLQNTPQSQLPLGLVDDISMMPKADMFNLYTEKKNQVSEFQAEIDRFKPEGDLGKDRMSMATNQYNAAVQDLNYIANTYKNIYGGDNKEIVTQQPTNPFEIEKERASAGWRTILKDGVKTKFQADPEVNNIANKIVSDASQLQKLDVDPFTGQSIKTNFIEAKDRVKQIKSIIDDNVFDEENRSKAYKDLAIDARAVVYEGLKDQNTVNKWTQDGYGNPFIGIGLSTLEMIDPNRAKSLQERIDNIYASESDKQLYKKELETIGISTVMFEGNRNIPRVSGTKSADTLNNWVKYAEDQRRTQSSRYGDLVAADVDRTLLDVTEGVGPTAGRKALFNIALGATEGVERGVRAVYNYLTKNREERIAEDMKMDHSKYVTDEVINYSAAGSSLIQQEFIPTITDQKLRAEIDAITAKDITREEKYKATYPLVKKAYEDGLIDFVYNPNKGNINITSKSIINTLATSGARSIGNLAIATPLGGGVFTGLIAGLDAAASKYDEQFRAGDNDPALRAVRSGVIVGGLAGVMDEAAALASALKGVKPSLVTPRPAVGAAVRGFGEQVAKEEVEEIATEILDGDIKNIKEVILATAITTAPIAGTTSIISGRKNSELYRQLWFEAGSSLSDTQSGLKKLLDAGEINQEQYDASIKRANKMAEVVKTMPRVDRNGTPLSDKQKAKYADNLMIKFESESIPDTIPTSIATEIKESAKVADDENAVILNGPELSKTESGMAVDKEGQLIEKKEQMKEKFGLKEEDFVGEAFTQEEDAADREALPESEFKTEEELINFLETGEYGMLTGQNPDAVPLSKDANRTLNERATKWLADRGLKAIPIFGKYGNSERSFLVPGLTKAQAIEFAKDFQQDSVAHSSGLVYRDGSFNPRSGKPFAQPMFNEGGDFFSTINVGGNIIDFAVPYDTDTKIQADKTVGDSINTALSNAVDTAAKSLEKAGIKFSIIDSSTDQSGAARGNQAVFVSETGEVIIDKSKLQDDIEAGIVVWHEASHPVMNILRNTNKDLYDSVVKGLTAAAKKDAGIGRTLGWAEDNYDGDSTKQDEALVEVVGRINAGIIDINNLDTGFRQKLIDFINGIAKYLGIDPILNDRDIAQFKKTVSEVADALKTGRDIAEIVGEENVKEYMNKIDAPEAVVGGVYTPQARVSENTLSVYDSKEVEKLPIRTLEDIHGAFGGRAVVINSDPTRVGELTLPSGKKIFMYGGPGYLSVKDNVDGNVGFATTQLSKVKSWAKYIGDVFGNNPGITLVATQAPTSILSNSYALRYVMDAISTLPKSVLRSSDFKNEFFGKDLVLLKDAFGEKAYNEFVSKYKKADLSDNKVIDDMISEMAYKVGDDNKPASFKARGAFVSNLLGGLAKKSEIKTVEGDTGYVSKKPQKFIAKQLMDRLGINAEKVIRDIGEPSLVDLYMNEGKWGMAVSGFETDPNLSVDSVQEGGVKHPLFNAKFPGKNPFILDGAYEVDKIFKPVEMTGPSGEPYTKKAAQMLAGSMYVKGMPTEVDGTFEYTKSAPAGGAIQASAGNRIPEAKQKKLTDDGKGNYVFFHYSGKKLNKIDPSKFGSNLATGRDERPGVGISMFYVDNKTSEPGVPTNFGYAVRVPKENVYPINEDPLNFYDEAKAMFDKDFPGQAFDANKQVGYITKVANEKGFDMTIVDWNIKGKKALRAQTTESIKPEVYKKMEFKDGFEREVFTPELEKLKPGIQESVGGRTAEDFGKFGPENSKEFKTAAYVMRSKADGMNDTEIATGLLSVNPGMTPQEAKDIIDNPEDYIRSKFNYLSPALQENLINRARVVNIYAKSRTKADPAFDTLEVRESSLDEAEIPKKGALKKWLGDFKRQWLDAAKGLPDWVLAIKDISGGVKDLQIRQATDMVKDLKKTAESIGFNDWDAFSKAMRSMKRDPEAISIETGIQPWFANIPGKQLENAPAVIPAEIAALPEEIIPFVYSMRGMIDNLSSELVASGFVTPSQALTLTENLGEYVNRAYKVFNEKGYKPSKESIRDARKFLADKYIKQLATESAGMLTFEQIEKKAIEMANKDIEAIISKKLNPYFKKNDSRDTGILKERKEIPAPIRKLMGEYTDPGTAFIITVAKQASLKAASQYLTGLRNNGMGSIFFEENDPERPVEFSVKISSEGSDSKSPLNGLYTTPDIAEALESVGPTFNDLTNAWMKLVGAVRWGKTVGSVVTQLKNFESNIGFAVMNGLIFSGENTQALKGAGKYFGGQVTGKKLDELTQKVMALGLVNQSVGTGELRKMLGSGDIHDIAVELAVTGKAKGAMNWIGKPFKAANKLYQLSDDFWKVYGYLNERELMSNALYNKKYDQLSVDEQTTVDLEASERVKMTQPTYDRVWAGAKYVSERAPIFGNFISFQAEIVRVLNNTIKIAARDMKSDNPKVKALGYKRFAGMVTYVGLRTVLTYAAAQAAGIGVAGLIGMFDDEEEKEKEAGLRKALPPFMRTGDLLAIPQKDPSKFTVFELSSIDPYGIVFKSMNALTEGREGIFGETMDPGVPAAMAEFFSGFLEQEMTFKTFNDLMNNSNPRTGEKIIKNDQTKSQAFLEAGKYVANQLKPSTIGLVERLMGKTPETELGSMFGARPYDVDLNRSFGRVMAQAGKDMEDVVKEYGRVRFDKELTPAEKKEKIKAAEERLAYYANSLSETYRQFLLLGADKKQLDEMIKKRGQVKSTGFNKAFKKSILTGDINPETYFK